MSNLVIVESPNKVKSVAKYLGPGWEVAASVGHIRDLPEKEIGVEAPSFVPTYVVSADKTDVVARLRAKAAAADAVYLATDPDREGEAIAWHLQQALGLTNPHRVKFQEISEKAVKAAVASPGVIDTRLVEAQEARRVIDRLTGYRVSPHVMRVSGERMSAGRVQSPALRLVVDRELEIRAFKTTANYGVRLHFDGGWQGDWYFAPLLPKDAENKLWMDKSFAEKAAAVRKVMVEKCDETVSKSAPPAPFTTSTLQQAGSVALGFDPEETMKLAQSLFAGTEATGGFITYHRTDSPNLSDGAIEMIREYATVHGLPMAVTPRRWQAKGDAQEAHEACRPTDFNRTEAGSTENERKLYRLIWQRAVASQMAEAEYDVRTAHLLSVDKVDGHTLRYIAKGRKLCTKGWLDVTGKDAASEDNHKEPENPIPKLIPGSVLTAIKGEVLSKKTQPPSRYSKASLVKKLESEGIGRPATYAAIMKGIEAKKYIRAEKGMSIAPTPLGEQLIALLRGNFSFLEMQYTRDMETQLDSIAKGDSRYLSLVTNIDADLGKELAAVAGLATAPRAGGPADTSAKDAGVKCPKCGGIVRAKEKLFVCDGGDFKLWREICKKKLTETQAKQLIKTGSTPQIEGFVSKAGKSFSASLKLSADKSGSVDFVFDNAPKTAKK